MKDAGGAPDLVLFRDAKGIDPSVDSTAENLPKNLYTTTPAPEFVCCDEDIWAPDEVEEEKVDLSAIAKAAQSKRRLEIERYIKKKIVDFVDHPLCLVVFTLMTLWSLFAEARARRGGWAGGRE